MTKYSKDTKRITCIGEIVIDCIVNAPRLPIENETLIIDNYNVLLELGGPALNTAWYLSQFGLPVDLAGLHGTDEAERVYSTCTQVNMGKDNLIAYEGHSDFLVGIIIGDIHRSYLLRSSIPSSALDILTQRESSTNWLLLCGSRHKIVRNFYSEISCISQEKTIFFSPSYALFEYNKEELEKILKKSQYVFINESETLFLLNLFGAKNPAYLAKSYNLTLIQTKGPNGACVFGADTVIELPCVPTNVVNTSGAGDAFCAGFIFCLIMKGSLRESLAHGLAAAACVVESPVVRTLLCGERLSGALKYFGD